MEHIKLLSHGEVDSMSFCTDRRHWWKHACNVANFIDKHTYSQLQFTGCMACGTVKLVHKSRLTWP